MPRKNPSEGPKFDHRLPEVRVDESLVNLIKQAALVNKLGLTAAQIIRNGVKLFCQKLIKEAERPD
jgi:hypothetical protein